MARSDHVGMAEPGGLGPTDERSSPIAPDRGPRTDTMGGMTDLGRAPSAAARLVVAFLSALVVGVGAYWVWAMIVGALVAGVPSWAVGFIMVGLVVALAAAVDRVSQQRG